MLVRQIPASGEALPVLGIGTWQTFDVGPRAPQRATLSEVLSAFSALGGRLVDSSPMYGNAETVVGDLAGDLGLHAQLFIATKVWTSGRAEGIRQMDASMRKLRVSTVDLMQVHNLVDVETHLDTLAGWKRDGRVRYVGITHYTASAHEALARVLEGPSGRQVDFVQVNYSLGEPEAARRLLPLALDRGVAVLVNRPFGGGGLLRRLRGRPLPGWAAELGYASWAQLALAFVVAHPAVTCVIPATAQVGHLQENMAVGDGPLPNERQLEEIVAAAG
jgi:aryl-alcohol dehydrogenase-like predicted oxidoreductase